MAKISAGGATEIAKIRATRNGYDYLFAINSKGTVLYRITGDAGTGYTIYDRHREPTRAALLALLARNGYAVTD